MTERRFSHLPIDASPDLEDLPLAPPKKRIAAFVVDWILVTIPTAMVSIGFAALSLYMTDPSGFRGLHSLFMGIDSDEAEIDALSDIAPMLVRIDAPGLPLSVSVAVENSNYEKAGQLLKPYEIDFFIGDEPPTPAPMHIVVDVLDMIPNLVRGVAIFFVAALYFTFLTGGQSKGTFGKRIYGIRVVRLDNKPLRYFESFERFAGYLASAGTFGLGFLDLWREPNRRLAHDKVSNTVVLQRPKKSAKKRK